MESVKLLSLKRANLLDLSTYRFVGSDDKTPELLEKCAILSHRWKGEEIVMRPWKEFVESTAEKLTESLIDSIMYVDREATIEKLKTLTKVVLSNEQLTSIAKVLRFCLMAKRDGHECAWVDTCCIDKDNLTAMTKDFGLMWDYYSASSRCYVYLDDVTADDMTADDTTVNDSPLKNFKKSKWFTRGWTLQELLASYKSIGFYNSHWRLIKFGSKADFTSIIADCTDITPGFLKDPHKACVAVKMSWLSKRETSFDEDMAYCMLGIFGVHIPVDYKEGGERAFRRLQMALIEDPRYTNDESIFAWTGSPKDSTTGSSRTAWGLLAPWPSHFGKSRWISRIPDKECKSRLAPRIVTNAVTIQIPAKYPHINNGADRNIAEAAKSNEKKIVLNVQEDTKAGESTDTALVQGKQKRNEPSKKVTLTLIKNPGKQWRRLPDEDQEWSENTKKSKNTMPLSVAHTVDLDNEPELSKAKRGGFLDGMRAAIEARKGMR